MQDSDVISNSSGKKTAIEDLSKEELIKRCKSLLNIAQKAKAAKDEILLQENELKKKVTLFEEEVEKLQDENVSKEKKIQVLEDSLNEVRNQLTEEERRRSELEVLLQKNMSELKIAEEDFELQKNGFIEELNKMNDILKQRGEIITKLEDQIQKNQAAFQVDLEAVRQVVVEREKRIEELESEINRHDSQSEVVSSSTFSKVEEYHRMKDVEDSLEERYNKLKMLAIKMKKKISEQNIQIRDLENKAHHINKDNIANMSHNLQALQSDVDRLNDELDSKKKEMAVLKKDLETSIQECTSVKESAAECKNEIKVLTAANANHEKIKKNLESSIKELKEQLELVSKEKEAEKILRVELSKECDGLKSEIRSLNAKVIEVTRNNELAKQNLLELEISDYEKALKELNFTVQSLQNQVAEKETVITKSNESAEILATQLKLVEAQMLTEQERANNVKVALDETRTQLEESLEVQSKQDKEIRELNVKLQSCRMDLENLSIAHASASAELHKAKTGSTMQLESLRKQIAAFEIRLEVEQTEKENLLKQLTQLESDFKSYKIRATSVLKKQKTENQSGTAHDSPNDLNATTDQVEREMLQRVVEMLKIKVTELESQLSLTQSEVCHLRAEKDRLIAMETKTSQSMEQRLQLVTQEMENARQEHRTTIARLQSENQLLASLHKDQMENLKSRHAQELMTLQQELDSAHIEISRLQRSISNLNIPPSVSPHDHLQVDVDILERQQGEGSEDVGSSSQMSPVDKNHHKPIPLEMLLNSPSTGDDMETVATITEDKAALQQLNESLAVCEKRCRHLAALLAESEANEARLTQLSEALKEEIRRTQRAEERQKHIDNLEYLKNIVLKFVTLPRGEERSRLVPVLTTLLRLSPAEIQDVNQAVSKAMDSSIRPSTWSGVFNIWAPPQ